MFYVIDSILKFNKKKLFFVDSFLKFNSKIILNKKYKNKIKYLY